MKSLIILLLLWANTCFSQSYYSETGKAVFHSEVPLHTFSGSSQNLTGMIDLETNTIDFYLDLETLKTGIGKRDRDMRETLETDQYPFAEFFGKLINEIDPENNEPQSVTVQGTFKIHGKQQDVEIDGVIEPIDEGLHVRANWILLLKDYDIEPPRLLFVKVDQEQKIEIDILLEPQNN